MADSPKLSILVDKSDGKRVYAATHTKGVVVDDNLWGKLWGTDSGKLRLTKVLEEVPVLIEEVAKNTLKLNIQNNKIGLSVGGLNIEDSYINIPNSGYNTIEVGNTLSDKDSFKIDDLDTDDKVPTGRAVHTAIQRTVGFTIQEIDII